MISRLFCLSSASEDSRAALPVTLGFHHAQLLSGSGVVLWVGPSSLGLLISQRCACDRAAVLKGFACAGSSSAFICSVL